MAQKKFYAVKAGRTTGIFTTWVACKKSIDGYSGAVYKSFLTKAEAEGYLHGDTEAQPPVAEADAVIAYIDGSYEHAIKRYSYGVVLLLGDEKKTFSGYGEEPELAALRNVAGELKGAMESQFAFYPRIRGIYQTNAHRFANCFREGQGTFGGSVQ